VISWPTLLDFARGVYMIRPIMLTVGQFITESAGRMAPYERLRVGRVGCAVSLIAIAGAIVAIAIGLWDTGDSIAAGFRFVVLSGIGTALLLFVIYALLETVTERSVKRAIDEFIRESGQDLDTLVKAAEMRQGHIKGGPRIAAVLKALAAGR
jgi:hypothetical protein